MDLDSYVVICAVAFGASVLTFCTGFGLGTLLLPAFAAFFPVQAAVALTAVVHLLNNLFKLVLVGRKANAKIALRFGAPAIVASFAGAAALVWLSGLEPLFRYELGGRSRAVQPVALVIAVLMVVFAVAELWPKASRASIPSKYLPVGGLLTGFFGGLSGHQGALRSTFLLRAGLGKEAFIATGVVVAAAVDITRLAVYSERFLMASLGENGTLLGAAVAAAFGGTLAGKRLSIGVSMRAIEATVAVLLLFIASGLAAGLL